MFQTTNQSWSIEPIPHGENPKILDESTQPTIASTGCAAQRNLCGAQQEERRRRAIGKAAHGQRWRCCTSTVGSSASGTVRYPITG